MMDAGQALAYLRGEIERELQEVNIQIDLFSKEATDTARKAAQGLYQLVRNVHKNKDIPFIIPKNLRLCYQELLDLSDETGKSISPRLNPAEREAVKRRLVSDLKKIRDEISTVESFLVQIEQEGRKKNYQVRA